MSTGLGIPKKLSSTENLLKLLKKELNLRKRDFVAQQLIGSLQTKKYENIKKMQGYASLFIWITKAKHKLGLSWAKLGSSLASKFIH